MRFLGLLLCGWLAGYLVLPCVLGLLVEGGAVRENYRGRAVPVGAGLVLLLAFLGACFFLFFWVPPLFLVASAFVLVLFCLLGLADDLLGSRERRGLRGHFGALWRGRLTTGALKALGGAAGAVLFALAARPGGSVGEVAATALLVALAANTLNLFDLRPGRALKVFFAWGLAVAAAAWGSPGSLLLAPLLGSALAYARRDLRGEAMLGDTGSNLLGAALGVATAGACSLPGQVVVVVVLVALHVFTERYSLTALIAGNRFLSFLDGLGRAGEEDAEKEGS